MSSVFVLDNDSIYGICGNIGYNTDGLNVFGGLCRCKLYLLVKLVGIGVKNSCHAKILRRAAHVCIDSLDLLDLYGASACGIAHREVEAKRFQRSAVV